MPKSGLQLVYRYCNFMQTLLQTIYVINLIFISFLNLFIMFIIYYYAQPRFKTLLFLFIFRCFHIISGAGCCLPFVCYFKISTVWILLITFVFILHFFFLLFALFHLTLNVVHIYHQHLKLTHEYIYIQLLSSLKIEVQILYSSYAEPFLNAQ